MEISGGVWISKLSLVLSSIGLVIDIHMGYMSMVWSIIKLYGERAACGTTIDWPSFIHRQHCFHRR